LAAVSDDGWVDFFVDAPNDSASAEFVAFLRERMPEAEVQAGQGGEALPSAAPLHRHRSRCSVRVPGEGAEGTAARLRSVAADLDVEVDDGDRLTIILA
jgi:hypothetical protein